MLVGCKIILANYSHMKNILKKVVGQIADQSGHTDFVGTVDEAVDLIFEEVKKTGKWTYINGSQFPIINFDTTERNAIIDAFENEEAPYFVIAGKLQGGKPTANELARIAIANRAVRTRSFLLNNNITVEFRSSKRPVLETLAVEGVSLQLGISIRMSRNGDKVVRVETSSFAGADARVRNNIGLVMAALSEVFGDGNEPAKSVKTVTEQPNKKATVIMNTTKKAAVKKTPSKKPSTKKSK